MSKGWISVKDKEPEIRSVVLDNSGNVFVPEQGIFIVNTGGEKHYYAGEDVFDGEEIALSRKIVIDGKEYELYASEILYWLQIPEIPDEIKEMQK